MVSIVSIVLLGIAIGISFMKVKWLLLGYYGVLRLSRRDSQNFEPP
jgi:hypothetical protein